MAATNPVEVWPKDPLEVLDYTMDWNQWLGLDVLAGVNWSVPSGIANAGNYSSQSTTTIWLVSGVSGVSYLVTCLVTTTGGRTGKRTIQINVGDR